MQKGFTLIEVMIAIFVTIVGVMGIYGLVPHIFGVVEVNVSRFVAAQLAKEGIEIIRNIRDVNYLEATDIANPGNAWDEDFDNCASFTGGCEADYAQVNQLTNTDPVLPVFTARHLMIDSNGFFSYSSGEIISSFQRKIIVDDCGAGCLDVKVTVYWPKKTFLSSEITSLEVEEKIYDWR